MPVLVQEDRRGVIKPDTSVARILENGALIVERQMEMMNVFLGFEQASKFVITDAAGNHIGYLAEEERGISQTLARQAFRTHRAFTAHVMDREGKEVLTIRRPFAWINSRIHCVQPQLQEVVGEAQQVWHPWRRRYDLFLNRQGEYEQFATIDEPFLSWDFTALDKGQQLVGSINRDFKGFGREIFTDTGCYVLRLDAASSETTHSKQMVAGSRPEGMTLDERAMLLATAVSVDVDYFSRHSHAGRGGMFDMLPLWIPGMSSRTEAEPQQPSPSEGTSAGQVGSAGAATGAGVDASARNQSDDGWLSDNQAYSDDNAPTGSDDFQDEAPMEDEASGSFLDNLSDWFPGSSD